MFQGLVGGVQTWRIGNLYNQPAGSKLNAFTLGAPSVSEANPYSPSQTVQLEDGIQKLKIQPIQLLKDSYALIGEQYWLFFGISFVAMLIGSAVPFGILMGPMMIGVYLCFMDKEKGKQVEFGTLFKGFDQFGDALIASLIMVGVSILVVIPAMIILAIVSFGPAIASAGPGGEPNGGLMAFGVAFFYMGIIVVSVLASLPFLFVFQLMAERKLKPMDAIKLSFRAVWRNLGGILKFFCVLMLISILLVMMCYIPVFFFIPISFGAMFLLYRKIFPPENSIEVHGSEIQQPIAGV